jgi:AcrR family transcriptional regulator
MGTHATGDPVTDAATNETIRTILEAGALCLARLGRDKTSIQDIADAAALGRTTVYRYFSDRNHLLKAIGQYERRRQQAELQARITDGASLEEALAITAEVIAASVLAYNVPEHLHRHDHELAQHFMEDSRIRHERTSSLIRPYIARAYQAGELAPDVTEDEAVEWAALVLLLIPTMPPSANLDITDPCSLGRTFARRICQGIGRPQATAGGGTARVKAEATR